MGENQHGMGLGAAGLADTLSALAPGRSCGTCGLCCKVLPVAELHKPAGQWCVHFATGSGCSIHAGRPDACRAFFCAWRIDPNLGPEWKPDVSRFVLSADPGKKAFMVTVDPGMPLAWKREPYFSHLKQFSEISFRQGNKVLVDLRGRITVILPDREVPIGVVGPADEVVVWREGSTYGARLQRGLEPAQAPVQSSVREPAKPPGSAPSVQDAGFLDSVFREAFEKTRQLLDDPRIDDLQALTWTFEGRSKVLDETAATYAVAGRAECRSGCVSCCYLMVLGTPFEILSIARQLLQTKAAAEIAALKARLEEVARVPLDPSLRAKAAIPCALLENGLCAAYEQRPSVCRMMLSQSRAACDSCLKGASGSIPYIEQPSQIAAVMQMGIDYALISRRNLSIERAELSRALLIALADYEGALASWLGGKDPFAGAHVDVPGVASGRERTIAAATRLGLA